MGTDVSDVMHTCHKAVAIARSILDDGAKDPSVGLEFAEFVDTIESSNVSFETYLKHVEGTRRASTSRLDLFTLKELRKSFAKSCEEGIKDDDQPADAEEPADPPAGAGNKVYPA